MQPPTKQLTAADVMLVVNVPELAIRDVFFADWDSVDGSVAMTCTRHAPAALMHLPCGP